MKDEKQAKENIQDLLSRMLIRGYELPVILRAMSSIIDKLRNEVKKKVRKELNLEE